MALLSPLPDHFSALPLAAYVSSACSDYFKVCPFRASLERVCQLPTLLRCQPHVQTMVSLIEVHFDSEVVQHQAELLLCCFVGFYFECYPQHCLNLALDVVSSNAVGWKSACMELSWLH